MNVLEKITRMRLVFLNFERLLDVFWNLLFKFRGFSRSFDTVTSHLMGGLYFVDSKKFFDVQNIENFQDIHQNWDGAYPSSRIETRESGIVLR